MRGSASGYFCADGWILYTESMVSLQKKASWYQQSFHLTKVWNQGRHHYTRQSLCLRWGRTRPWALALKTVRLWWYDLFHEWSAASICHKICGSPAWCALDCAGKLHHAPRLLWEHQGLREQNHRDWKKHHDDCGVHAFWPDDWATIVSEKGAV